MKFKVIWKEKKKCLAIIIFFLGEGEINFVMLRDED
jgi:hypothetical protein